MILKTILWLVITFVPALYFGRVVGNAGLALIYFAGWAVFWFFAIIAIVAISLARPSRRRENLVPVVNQTDAATPPTFDNGFWLKRTTILLVLGAQAALIGGMFVYGYYGGDSGKSRTQQPIREVQVLPDRSLNQLLDRADQQHAERKLTTPRGNNALETYREVLRHSPGNTDALAGLERIRDQYEQWAQKAEREGNDAKGQRYYERASQVSP